MESRCVPSVSSECRESWLLCIGCFAFLVLYRNPSMSGTNLLQASADMLVRLPVFLLN